MNDALGLNFTFAGTTVNPVPAQVYLFEQDLGYYKNAYSRGERSETVLAMLERSEDFDKLLRRYVGGKHKTTRKLLANVRDFVAYNSTAAKHLIKLVIIGIRKDFIKYEWYELMPRFEKAVVKIEKLLV